MLLINLLHSSHTTVFSKSTIVSRKCRFFTENTEISKIKEVLVLMVNTLKLVTYMYLCTKFQVSSINLTSFRQAVILGPLPPQNKLLIMVNRDVLKKN